MRQRAIAVLLLTLATVWTAPLVGLAAAGHPVTEYAAFPPRTKFVPHPPFDWTDFAVLSLALAFALAIACAAIVNVRSVARRPPRRAFPWWSWLGLGLMAASWFLAWHGVFPAGPFRRHVFTPLWLGYILFMNGLALRQTGWAPLTHRTGWFLALFPVSSLFWWVFEYLNQFVGNWYYTGVEAGGDLNYFLQATLPFSTVIPAVASTWAWLRGFPRLEAVKLPAVRGHDGLAWLALAGGSLGLIGIGLWPEALFPMLWLAPLLVLYALQRLLLGETLFASLRYGDWRPVLQPALAALLCGLLWELWNFGSVAKWHYSIPYVQRFFVFEMPVLGYAGYLPFGIECALTMDLVARCIERRPLWRLGLQ